MAFQQLIFTLLILPLAVILFRFVPDRAKKPVLLIFSLFYIVWGSAADLFYVACEIAFNYLTAMLFLRLKKDGYKRSIELSRQYGLYRQKYCGCIYSRQNETA